MRIEVSVFTTYNLGHSNTAKCLFCKIVDVPVGLVYPFDKTIEVLHLLFSDTPHIINFKIQFV